LHVWSGNNRAGSKRYNITFTELKMLSFHQTLIPMGILKIN